MLSGLKTQAGAPPSCVFSHTVHGGGRGLGFGGRCVWGGGLRGCPGSRLGGVG